MRARIALWAIGLLAAIALALIWATLIVAMGRAPFSWQALNEMWWPWQVVIRSVIHVAFIAIAACGLWRQVTAVKRFQRF